MRVDIGNFNPAVKFYFDDNNLKGGHVLIRQPSFEVVKDITRQCTTKSPPEYRRGVRYEIPDKIDEDKQNELMWDYTIDGWGDIEDKSGKPIPCTIANKVGFMQGWSWFAIFIGNSLEKLGTLTPKEPPKEAEIKNSSNSQSE